MKHSPLLLLAIGLSQASAQVHLSALKFRSGRVVGGVEAEKHEFPSVLNQGSHGLCGATLIHPTWALTAAHCGKFKPIVAGDHLIATVEGTEKTVVVIERVVHPDYEKDTFASHDIALLKLEVPLELTDTVNVARLAPADFIPTGNAVVIGWGKTESGGYPDELRKISVPLVDDEECRAIYDTVGYTIDQTMICAGTADVDSCEGDLGGPMFCEFEGGLVHCGIVSFGIGCGRQGYPGVYARTSIFRQFIEDTIMEKLA